MTKTYLLLSIILLIIVIGCAKIPADETMQNEVTIKQQEQADLADYPELSKCSEIEDAISRDKCRAKIAITQGEINFCENIQNQNLKNVCKKINLIPKMPVNSQDLPKDKRLYFGRTSLNSQAVSSYPIKSDYTLYSINYQGSDLKKIFTVPITIEDAAGTSFHPKHLVSPDGQWIIFMTSNYDEGIRLYKKLYYIVKNDGTNLKEIVPEFSDNDFPGGYPVDFVWSLDNIAYFKVKGKWFAYNPEKETKVAVEQLEFEEVRFVITPKGNKYYQPGGKLVDGFSLPNQHNDIFSRFSRYLLSPKSDLVAYRVEFNRGNSESLYDPNDQEWFLAVAKSDGSDEKFIARVSVVNDFFRWSDDSQYILVGQSGWVDGYWAPFPERTGYEVVPIGGGTPSRIIVK